MLINSDFVNCPVCYYIILLGISSYSWRYW